MFLFSAGKGKRDDESISGLSLPSPQHKHTHTMVQALLELGEGGATHGTGETEQRASRRHHLLRAAAVSVTLVSLVVAVTVLGQPGAGGASELLTWNNFADDGAGVTGGQQHGVAMRITSCDPDDPACTFQTSTRGYDKGRWVTNLNSKSARKMEVHVRSDLRQGSSYEDDIGEGPLAGMHKTDEKGTFKEWTPRPERFREREFSRVKVGVDDADGMDSWEKWRSQHPARLGHGNLPAHPRSLPGGAGFPVTAKSFVFRGPLSQPREVPPADQNYDMTHINKPLEPDETEDKGHSQPAEDAAEAVVDTAPPPAERAFSGGSRLPLPDIPAGAPAQAPEAFVRDGVEYVPVGVVPEAQPVVPPRTSVADTAPDLEVPPLQPLTAHTTTSPASPEAPEINTAVPQGKDQFLLKALHEVVEEMHASEADYSKLKSQLSVLQQQHEEVEAKAVASQALLKNYASQEGRILSALETGDAGTECNPCHVQQEPEETVAPAVEAAVEGFKEGEAAAAAAEPEHAAQPAAEPVESAAPPATEVHDEEVGDAASEEPAAGGSSAEDEMADDHGVEASSDAEKEMNVHPGLDNENEPAAEEETNDGAANEAETGDETDKEEEKESGSEAQATNRAEGEEAEDTSESKQVHGTMPSELTLNLYCKKYLDGVGPPATASSSKLEKWLGKCRGQDCQQTQEEVGCHYMTAEGFCYVDSGQHFCAKNQGNEWCHTEASDRAYEKCEGQGEIKDWEREGQKSNQGSDASDSAEEEIEDAFDDVEKAFEGEPRPNLDDNPEGAEGEKHGENAASSASVSEEDGENDAPAEQEASDVESLQLQPGFHGNFYTGFGTSGPNEMPELDVLKPSGEFTSLNIDYGHEGELKAAVPDLPLDHFAIGWTGKIEIKEEGEYTFSTYSDDGSFLWVDDLLVVDNGGLHAPEEKLGSLVLTSGLHDVKIRFFEKQGGAVCVVKYSGADTGDAMQLLSGFHAGAEPESQVTKYEPVRSLEESEGLVEGFDGKYFIMGDEIKDMPDLDVLPASLEKVTPAIDFGNDHAFSDFDEAIPHDRIAARWTGLVKVEHTGDYTFTSNSDDGSFVYIDGNLVVNNGGLHAPQTRSGTVALGPGFHSIRVDFFENSGGAVCVVKYSGPDTNGVGVLVPAWHE